MTRQLRGNHPWVEAVHIDASTLEPEDSIAQSEASIQVT